jgi:hypothetical protein
MPALSQAQRGYIFAKFGADWAKKHHFANKGKLPEHVSSNAPKPKAKGKGK